MSKGFASSGAFAVADLRDAPAPITAVDLRADNLRRRIVVSRDRVTIDRSYRGIAMRVSVPVEAYRGVCVALRPGRTGGFFYQIRLEHRDADLSVPLAEATDDSEVWADWRSWARFFGLPALIERNDGLAVWGRNPGLSQARPAKRRARRRRPAFRARRFVPGGRTAVVHRESEIIARD